MHINSINSDASDPEYQVQCQYNHEDTCEQFEVLNETENRINCCHFHLMTSVIKQFTLCSH